MNFDNLKWRELVVVVVGVEIAPVMI